VLVVPVFLIPKLTVTVSFGSTAALAGEQLSEVTTAVSLADVEDQETLTAAIRAAVRSNLCARIHNLRIVWMDSDGSHLDLVRQSLMQMLPFVTTNLLAKEAAKRA